MRLGLLICLTLPARLAVAQTADTAHHAPGVTVSGVVRDSLAHDTLARATVQIIDADRASRFSRTVMADSLGRFSFDDVPEGRYALGFFHPMLDSLGIEALLREVRVNGHGAVHADVAIPSAARLRAAICGSTRKDSSAVVVGTARDAKDGTPAAGVLVTGEWLDLTITTQGIQRHMRRLVATTGDNGWFAICNVPSAGTILLSASRGADSTDRIEVQVPAEGFVRRELYVGEARSVVVGDTTRVVDSLAASTRRVHVGGGRLSGTIVAAANGQPLVGAQVSIADGPQTRANERGEWTLADAPAGTRMLEARAVGYYPERRQVDVVSGAAPVRLVLSTLKAVLDTIRVTANRVAYRRQNGFAERRRSGAGHYLGAADIARQNPLMTSDLFRMVPGMRLDRNAFDSTSIQMRGAFQGWCAPAIYLDGVLMPGIAADDIDAWVRPKDVTGIEIYSEATAPMQFQRAFGGCGSVVIWTK